MAVDTVAGEVSKKLGELSDCLGQLHLLTSSVDDTSDLDRVREKADALSKRIDVTCYQIVELADSHWTRKMQGLVSVFNTRASSPIASGDVDARFQRVTDKILRDTAAMLLGTHEVMYKVALGRLGIALEQQGAITRADMKEIAVEIAEWTTTVVLDFVPGSGTATKLLEKAFKNIGGVDLNEKLWRSWTDPIKREKLAELELKAMAKVEIVAAGFLEFYVFKLLRSAESLEKAMSTTESDA